MQNSRLQILRSSRRFEKLRENDYTQVKFEIKPHVSYALLQSIHSKYFPNHENVLISNIKSLYFCSFFLTGKQRNLENRESQKPRHACGAKTQSVKMQPWIRQTRQERI